MGTKFILFFITFILLAQLSFAQDSSLNNLNTIYYTKGQKFTINGQRLRIDDSIENYLSKNANAFNEYHFYKKNEHASALFIVGWLGTWIAGAIQIGHKNNLAVGLGLTGLASLFVGTNFYIKAIAHLKKGICYYNQQFGF